jgi:hypothetical protein
MLNAPGKSKVSRFASMIAATRAGLQGLCEVKKNMHSETCVRGHDCARKRKRRQRMPTWRCQIGTLEMRALAEHRYRRLLPLGRQWRRKQKQRA